MNLYSIEVKVCATVYVKANSEAEAMARLKAEGNCWDLDASMDVSELEFNNPALPEISVSPAMTCYGPWNDDGTDGVDVAEENIPEND